MNKPTKIVIPRKDIIIILVLAGYSPVFGDKIILLGLLPFLLSIVLPCLSLLLILFIVRALEDVQLLLFTIFSKLEDLAKALLPPNNNIAIKTKNNPFIFILFPFFNP